MSPEWTGTLRSALVGAAQRATWVQSWLERHNFCPPAWRHALARHLKCTLVVWMKVYRVGTGEGVLHPVGFIEGGDNLTHLWFDSDDGPWPQEPRLHPLRVRAETPQASAGGQGQAASLNSQASGGSLRRASARTAAPAAQQASSDAQISSQRPTRPSGQPTSRPSAAIGVKATGLQLRVVGAVDCTAREVDTLSTGRIPRGCRRAAC